MHLLLNVLILNQGKVMSKFQTRLQTLMCAKICTQFLTIIIINIREYFNIVFSK